MELDAQIRQSTIMIKTQNCTNSPYMQTINQFIATWTEYLFSYDAAYLWGYAFHCKYRH